MPRPEKKAKSAPKPKRNLLLPGLPYRVHSRDKFRDFLDAACTIDEQGNLYVMRVREDAEPSVLIVYAAGAWDAFEAIPAYHAEELEGTAEP